MDSEVENISDIRMNLFTRRSKPNGLRPNYFAIWIDGKFYKKFRPTKKNCRMTDSQNLIKSYLPTYFRLREVISIIRNTNFGDPALSLTSKMLSDFCSKRHQACQMELDWTHSTKVIQRNMQANS